MIAWAAAAAQQGSNVSATKHNLTSSGPGTVKTTEGGSVCRFCHTPHAANPIAPLWNRFDPGTTYKPYASTTLVSRPGQPTGSSRLCLSCHDGTIALTQTYNPRNAPGGSVFITSQDRGYIGTDLSDDHPISFAYDEGLASLRSGLRNPTQLPRELPLDENKQLQCTTCHDPHNDQFGQFLRMENTESRLCQACHVTEGWTVAAHSSSSASLASATRDTWDNLRATTVRQAACESCHRPHSAGGRQRLLRHEAEEDNCLSCHDGTVAKTNLVPLLSRQSTHPVNLTTGVHDPVETPGSLTKHVECVDCHNPHWSSASGSAVPPAIRSTMNGATGMTGTGTAVSHAQFEYQVCYKCHAGSNPMKNPVVERVLVNNDSGDEFALGNPSFHPVEGPGRNGNVPSLINPLTVSSVIYCTDCHASDSASGARGPHGSNWSPLLKRQYETLDNTVESPAAYALCYGCHSRDSILADESFAFHFKHVVEEEAPCSICHDAHGIDVSKGGTPENNAHLINFNTDYVEPDSITNLLEYRTTAPGAGECSLRCHQADHTAREYPGGGAGGAAGSTGTIRRPASYRRSSKAW